MGADEQLGGYSRHRVKFKCVNNDLINMWSLVATSERRMQIQQSEVQFQGGRLGSSAGRNSDGDQQDFSAEPRKRRQVSFYNTAVCIRVLLSRLQKEKTGINTTKEQTKRHHLRVFQNHRGPREGGAFSLLGRKCGFLLEYSSTAHQG